MWRLQAAVRVLNGGGTDCVATIIKHQCMLLCSQLCLCWGARLYVRLPASTYNLWSQLCTCIDNDRFEPRVDGGFVDARVSKSASTLFSIVGLV
jgi:hypothetical protein